jgi:uncharacterized protein (TIGR00369 family)
VCDEDSVAREKHFRKLERMYALAPVNDFFAPKIQISEGWAEVTLTVRPEFYHAAGAVHGAIYFKSLDDAAFFAVNSLVQHFMVLTVSFNLHLTRPVTSGEIRSVGKVMHRSKRLYVAESELLDMKGRIIAKGSGIFMPSNIPLTEKLGYS